MTASRMVVVIWALFMAAGLWLIIAKVSVHSELGELLPEGSTTAQRLLLSQVRTGAVSRLLLLAVQGEDPDQLATFSKAFGTALRESSLFEMVGNGMQIWSAGDQARLFQSRYLLSPTLDRTTFSAGALRAALEQRLEDLRSPLAPLMKSSVPEDPTGEFMHLLQAWSRSDAPATRKGVWMSADGTEALLVVQTKAPGFDADAQEVAQRELRVTFQRLARG